jgi:hypothetical protein
MENTTKAATAAAVYRYMVARARGGVLVYPQASPPVVADDEDPGFLDAINGRDDALVWPHDDRTLIWPGLDMSVDDADTFAKVFYRYSDDLAQRVGYR